MAVPGVKVKTRYHDGTQSVMGLQVSICIYVCVLREGDKVGCMLSMAEDEVQAMSGRAMRQRCIVSEMKVFATVFYAGVAVSGWKAGLPV